MGYGEFKSLREIAVPQGNPAEWVTEVGCGSRQHPGGTRQSSKRSRQNLQKSVAKSYRNLLREAPRSLRKRSGTLPEHVRTKKMQKVNFRPPKIHSSFLPGLVLAPFWGPAGSPKSTKNEPGDEKVPPEAAPEAIFVDFSRRCRSESLSGPIFGGSDPSKLCAHHSGSTILTKSPFSKKTPKT